MWNRRFSTSAQIVCIQLFQDKIMSPELFGYLFYIAELDVVIKHLFFDLCLIWLSVQCLLQLHTERGFQVGFFVIAVLISCKKYIFQYFECCSNKSGLETIIMLIKNKTFQNRHHSLPKHLFNPLRLPHSFAEQHYLFCEIINQ